MPRRIPSKSSSMNAETISKFESELPEKEKETETGKASKDKDLLTTSDGSSADGDLPIERKTRSRRTKAETTGKQYKRKKKANSLSLAGGFINHNTKLSDSPQTERKNAKTESEAEELISKALTDWRKTKANQSTDKVARKQKPLKKKTLSRSLSVSGTLSHEVTGRTKEGEFENLRSSDQGPSNSSKTKAKPTASFQEETEENTLRISVDKANTEVVAEGDERPKLSTYRKLSQKFNKKAVVESGRKREKKKARTLNPKFHLPRDESEMALDILNERLKAEGIKGVNKKERDWLLRNTSFERPVTSSSTSAIPTVPKEKRLEKGTPKSSLGPSHPIAMATASLDPVSSALPLPCNPVVHSSVGRPLVSMTPPMSRNNRKFKSKSVHISQLNQQLSLMEISLKELNEKYLSMVEDKESFRMQCEEMKEENETLLEENISLKQTVEALQFKIELSSMNAQERDKAIEEMELKMLDKLSKASSRETKIASELKRMLATQSKQETLLQQLRLDKKTLEADRADAVAAHEKVNNLLVRAQQNNSFMDSELKRLHSTKENLQVKVTTDQKDLEEAFEYITQLEESDVKLRTAVTLVNKQNKSVTSTNNLLKQQLSEAKAALAMSKFYADMDQDLVDNTPKLSSAIWDQPDVVSDATPTGPPQPPELPPPETLHILSSIPNYVALKRKKRREQRGIPLSIPTEEDPLEMADIFAKALMQRRNQMVDFEEDSEDSYSEEWDSSESE